MEYSKLPFTIAQQIEQLKSRGLKIDDPIFAEHYLSVISYYRLAGYWWPMQADKVTHIFKPEARFETVIDLYNFDRELRLILFDAIERIEIGVRTKLIYYLSLDYGPWWFENPDLFSDKQHHAETLKFIDEELARSKETFILDHYKRYTNPSRPPAWKTLETVTIGNLSKLYRNLISCEARTNVAKDLHVPKPEFLTSWFAAISIVRNICAHHGRLWNKKLPSRIKLFSNTSQPWLNQFPSAANSVKLYTSLCCVQYLLNAISPGNHFKQRLKTLLKRYTVVDLAAMGFPQDWQTEALWS